MITASGRNTARSFSSRAALSRPEAKAAKNVCTMPAIASRSASWALLAGLLLGTPVIVAMRRNDHGRTVRTQRIPDHRAAAVQWCGARGRLGRCPHERTAGHLRPRDPPSTATSSWTCCRAPRRPDLVTAAPRAWSGRCLDHGGREPGRRLPAGARAQVARPDEVPTSARARPRPWSGRTVSRCRRPSTTRGCGWPAVTARRCSTTAAPPSWRAWRRSPSLAPRDRRLAVPARPRPDRLHRRHGEPVADRRPRACGAALWRGRGGGQRPAAPALGARQCPLGGDVPQEQERAMGRNEPDSVELAEDEDAARTATCHGP